MRMVLTMPRLMIWLAVAAVWTLGVVVMVVDLWQCH